MSPLFGGRTITWDQKSGAYRVELDDGFRQVIVELMEQFLELLEDPGAPVLYRLFPPAYSDPADIQHQDEYRRLMQDDLVERRRAELELVASTARQSTLTEDQLLAWSRAINSVRLALGTYLDIREEDAERVPSTAEESAYHWLNYLLEETVEALSRHT
ncbi:MAG: DUF2017 family protein [Acidimicrobiales bacterium]|nr:DUF2017 family protein [Acidimicrobiales bacterium]